jgi:hypothetical protein
MFANDEMVTSGICASACVYAFAGGRGRYYAGANRLGIHQFYSQGNDIGNGTSQEISGMLVAYLQRMGVDALAFSASTSVRPNDIFWLSTSEASRRHLSNNGTEETTAELKQANGLTYLRIEQKYTNFSARFIFNCVGNGQLLLMGGIVTNLKMRSESMTGQHNPSSPSMSRRFKQSEKAAQMMALPQMTQLSG